MRVTLLGFTVPDNLADWINQNDPVMVTQTHRFAWALVDALDEAGCTIDLLSVAPVSDYPRNPRFWWPKRDFIQDGKQGVLLPFVNALGLKHLTRGLSAALWGGAHLHAKNPDWLLIHGVHSPFLWLGAVISRAGRIPVCVILTDPPGVVRPDDSRLRTMLKKIDMALTKKALGAVDATVVLAAPLAADFAPRAPFLVMEGIYDPTQWPDPTEDRGSGEEEFVVTYAGGLSAAYGVADLVNGFRKWDCPLARLQIFGRGELEQWIQQQTVSDPRIAPAALVSPGELGVIYQSSDVLVQPRPGDQSFVTYSFPSKLIEYMASGTPVISTRLPSIPADYSGMVEWAEDGEEGILKALERLRGTPVERRLARALRARTFIRSTRSSQGQGRRLVDFLQSVERARQS